MANRRDKKNRVLHTGEYQKANGRYEYRYTDSKGNRQSVYSWKLNPTDATPAGKTSPLSLREMEKQIARDMEDGIATDTSRNITLNDYWKIFFPTKKNLKQSTHTNYQYMYQNYIQDVLGCKRLRNIKYTDVVKFYNSLIHDKGFQPTSVENVHTILHQVLGAAVRDNLISNNPSDSALCELKKSSEWVKNKRYALTEEQQSAFTGFIRDSKTYKHWLPLFTFMLGTGCRVGEVLGLRWEDCDFEQNMISINHTLIYRVQDNGKCEYHIETPKTANGTREIPMLDVVRDALLQLKEIRLALGKNKDVIDGYSDFVFGNRFNGVLNPESVNRAIKRIYTEYNEMEREKALQENRQPILLPHFSAHHLRHTFCTRLCEQETDIKLIETIMGHADISTTMDIYNDISANRKQQSFRRLNESIKVL